MRIMDICFAGQKMLLENRFEPQIPNRGRLVLGQEKEERLLKAPPVNPRVYIFWYYNIDPKEGL